MIDHPKPRDKVIIFDQGVKISAWMKAFLKDRDVIFVANLHDAVVAQEKHGCDLLLCSLLLSHCTDAKDCQNLVARLGRNFRNIGFFEPSLHGSDRLRELGLKSFHAGFDINSFLPSLTLAFLSDNTSAYSVTHFGCNVAYDSSAAWTVPANAPKNAVPAHFPARAKSEIVEFSKPIFEYSCYLYSSYDARILDFQVDLHFIEKKVQNSVLRLSGNDLRKWILLAHTGTAFYETPEREAADAGRRGAEQIVLRCQVDHAGPIDHPVETAWLNDRPAVKRRMVVRCLDDCLVTGTGAVMTEKRLLGESGYLQFPPDPIRGAMRSPHPAGRIDGWTILAINRPAHNYYHWLIQLLPLIEVAAPKLRDAGVRSVTVVTAVTSRFHHEHIRLLLSDFSDVTVVSLKRHEFITVSQGLYSNLAGVDGPQNLYDEHLQMAATLKQRLGIKPEPATRHIYISRNDGTGRAVKNEAALISEVRARGFEVLTLSEMPLREQILAFSNARIVIGAHGAGLSNILYSSEQTTLIELLQSTYTLNAMMRLAQNVGARHIAKFFFPGENSEAFPGPWCIDIAPTCALLDRVLAETSGQVAA